MADFCHDWEPGGLGCCWMKCGCPPDCIGDFTPTARARYKEVEPGYTLVLGLCEGCGAWVVLVNRDGKYFVEHEDIGSGKTISSKEWVPYEQKRGDGDEGS